MCAHGKAPPPRRGCRSRSPLAPSGRTSPAAPQGWCHVNAHRCMPHARAPHTGQLRPSSVAVASPMISRTVSPHVVNAACQIGRAVSRRCRTQRAHARAYLIGLHVSTPQSLVPAAHTQPVHRRAVHRAAQTYTHAKTNTQTHTNTRTHAHTHAHTHTHTHTQAHWSVRSQSAERT
jgi:hypothetical protein